MGLHCFPDLSVRKLRVITVFNNFLLFYLQAKALYDFDGDTENGELTFTAGDTLFIVEQVGDK